MPDMTETQRTQSPESEMDRLLDELMAKIVAQKASNDDLSRYQEILASRTRLMRPPTISLRGLNEMRRKYA